MVGAAGRKEPPLHEYEETTTQDEADGGHSLTLNHISAKSFKFSAENQINSEISDLFKSEGHEATEIEKDGWKCDL